MATITILPESSSASRSFVRKTAKARLHKVVREHYLRDDIPCGVRACQSCASLYHSTGEVGVLSEHGRSWEGMRPHWILIDTNIILHHLDLISSPLFGSDIIIPQTVLEEVRHRSLPLYYRLRALIDDAPPEQNRGGATKRGWIMWNEAMEATWPGKRHPGESPNDRGDRAIRCVAAWYNEHEVGSKQPPPKRIRLTHSASESSKDSPKVFLLSEDAGNREKATKDGIAAFSVVKYLETMPAEIAKTLLDLVSADAESTSNDGKTKKPQELFPEYLPTAVLRAGIRSGKLFQGHFNPSSYNFLEASVSLTPGSTQSSDGNLNKRIAGRSILVQGRSSMNRATAGDLVVIEIFPESQWGRENDKVVESDTVQAVDDPDADGEIEDTQSDTSQAEPKAVAPHDRHPTGRVVAILKRAWRPYVCHLDRSSLPPSALQSAASLTSCSVFASPVAKSIPRIRIRTRQAAALLSSKFLVSIDRWDTTSRYPDGHFVRLLGGVEDKATEIESLLLEWEVPYRPFSKAILDCLPVEGDRWKVPPKMEDPQGIWNGREDFRNLPISSIDPPGCQDIDDALHAHRLPNGNVEAGVHIADVSYFVHPDTAMDVEASSRGTTVYLVDKRIDMLPSLLGTNLCSLRPHVERLAFSVIWELTTEAKIINVRFTKSVIASKSAFTYEEAQIAKDNFALADPITESVRLLNHLAIQLRAQRMAAGALNLASPEIKIHLESAESTEPIDVKQKALLETNSLVEEFMLLANISVADEINKHFPQTAVLRRHVAPPRTNFEVLEDVLSKRRGFTLDSSTSAALAKSLDACVDSNEPEFNTLVRIMATRCMLSAEYFGAGSVPRDTFGHYGLATPIYTHFTSPIRRYADIMVHRQLFAAISNTPLHASLRSKTHVDRVLDTINKRHRCAQHAGRASVEFYVALAMRAREQTQLATGGAKVQEDAFVIRTFENGIAVFVSALGLEGLVRFKQTSKYDPGNYALSFPRDDGEKSIGVFDRVRVEITVEQERHTQRGRVSMALVKPFDSRPS